MAALAKRTAYRLPYVKYSTGANEAICTAYRALGKPDSTAARRAFLAGRIIGEWHAESKCLFRRVSAISFSSASFLPILFWQDRKEWAAGGILRLRRRKDIPQGIKKPPGRAGRAVKFSHWALLAPASAASGSD